MEYKVILTQNNQLKRIIHESNNKEFAFNDYRKLIKESDDVIFEQQHINNNGIKRVNYTVYIVKTHVEGERRRFTRDKLGKLIEEDLLFDKWTIIDSIEYHIEENFWVYGYSPRNERKSIRDVVMILMKGMGGHRVTKEIIVVHNKLVIYNENNFDMVICKCIADAQRLHHLLYKTAQATKIKGLLFMGTANPITISQMYEIIVEETDWPIEKIRRTTTRP